MAKKRVRAPKVPQKTKHAPIDDGSVHLIYKIDGKPSEIDVFELGRVLDSLGNVITETNRLISKPDAGGLDIKVRPFEKGSFLMDLVLHVQKNPEYLFLLSQVDAVKQIKEVLECLGLIRRAGSKAASLIELLKNLKNGQPEKVEKKGPDLYDYHAVDGTVTPVSMQVHTLYNSGTINNYIFPAVAKPLKDKSVEAISTYLKGAQAQTAVQLDKEDAEAIRSYSIPPEKEIKTETIENTTTQLLHPKSGNYGEQLGLWTFRIAGSQRHIKATIKHKEFLAQYTSGVIRFYTGDLLKARVHERQTISSEGETLVNEIVEVIEYRPGHPSKRRQSDA